jgi:hypothetical protein
LQSGWPESASLGPPSDSTLLVESLDKVARSRRARLDLQRWEAMARAWLAEQTGWRADVERGAGRDRDRAGTPAAYAELAQEALAWVRALPRLAPALPPELWWQLLQQLVDLTIQAGGLDPLAEPLLHQWLAGELGLWLAAGLPEVLACRQAGAHAARQLGRGFESLVLASGMPAAASLPALPHLLASWARCGALLERCPEGVVALPFRVPQVAAGVLRMLRPDNRLIFQSPPGGVLAGQLLERIAAWSGDGEFESLWSFRRGSTAIREGSLPEPSSHEEQAGLAILRATWSRRSDLVAVDFSRPALQAEMTLGGLSWLSGTLATRQSLNGQELRPAGGWEVVAWHSEAESTYLELEQPLSAGARLQRQFLLAPRDAFVFLADVLLAPAAGQIEYVARWPLAPGVALELAAEAQEGFLTSPRRRCLVLPLPLPEWRREASPGELIPGEGAVELEMKGSGQALYAPLLLHWNWRPPLQQYTWRRLTVAQQRTPLPRDVAAGYRVQVGSRQWVFYKALTSLGNRTLLGVNLVSEFLAARFSKDGTHQPLVEIE